jgi:anti-sigma regulatory factor (Ser/Thr protein kinase)
MEVSRDFPPTPGSVPTGRHAVDRLADELSPEVLERIRSVVSEMLGASTSHAFRRGTGRIGLRVHVSPERARIEVGDLESDAPGTDEAELSGLLGLTLFLVDHLVDRWGVVPSPGPVLWAEIDLPPPP